MKRDTLNKISKIIGIIFIALGAGVLVWTAALSNAQDIWFDELFTVELASKPLSQMISLAAGDVHPPLYYIYVRLVYLLLQWTGITVITAAKISAMLPYIFIMIYAVAYIRPRFGWISAGLTVFLIETMPQLSQYMVECRMYSIAMFTVMAMFIHGMEAVRVWDIDEKRKTYARYIHLGVAVLYGIASMYLHYFAFIGASCVAIYMLVYCVYQKKKSDNSRILGPKGIIISFLVAILSYIPWLRVVLSQVGAVKANYWIQPVSWRTFPGCIKYIFKPEFEGTMVNYLCVAVFVLTYVGVFVDYLISSERKSFILATALIPVALIIVGYIISIVVKPVFVYRYMVPVLGVFWMGYACLLGWVVKKCMESFDVRKGKNVFAVCVCIVITVIIMAVSIRDFNMFRWEEQKKIEGMETTNDAFELIQSSYTDTTLVCNFNQVQAVLWYYLHNTSMLWGETDELLVADICNRSPLYMTDLTEDMTEFVSDQNSYVDGKSGFIFVGSGNAREEIIDFWESQGMEVTEIADSCLIERYYFNLYKVELNVQEDN